jgi:hypothetical protein
LPGGGLILYDQFVLHSSFPLVLLHEEFAWLEQWRASRRSAGRLLRGLQLYLDRSGVTLPTSLVQM